MNIPAKTVSGVGRVSHVNVVNFILILVLDKLVQEDFVASNRAIDLNDSVADVKGTVDTLTKIVFCYEVSFSICVDIKSAAFFQCVTLKKGSRFDVNTDQETDLITEKNFSTLKVFIAT